MVQCNFGCLNRFTTTKDFCAPAPQHALARRPSAKKKPNDRQCDWKSSMCPHPRPSYVIYPIHHHHSSLAGWFLACGVVRRLSLRHQSLSHRAATTLPANKTFITMATLFANHPCVDDNNQCITASALCEQEDCFMTSALDWPAPSEENADAAVAAGHPPPPLGRSHSSQETGEDEEDWNDEEDSRNGSSSASSSHGPLAPLLLLTAPPPPPLLSNGMIDDEDDENDGDGLPELFQERDEHGASSSPVKKADTDADADIDAAMNEVLEQQEQDEEEQTEELLPLDDDLFAPSSPVRAREEGPARHPHGGGLLNLGNTCYMASALQMLATLDEFLDRLRGATTDEQDSKANTDDYVHTTGDSKDNHTLREALLVLVRRLHQGETVSPHAFKRVVDDKSPLFQGYRQQDAHEFLTTLLDLIDEDCKRTARNETVDHDEATAAGTALDQEMDLVDDERQEGPEGPTEVALDEAAEVASESESSRKKPRTEELQDSVPMEEDDVEQESEGTDPAEESTEAPPAKETSETSNTPPSSSLATSACRSSFSGLNLDEIEQLLHDTPNSTRTSCAYPSSEVSMTYQPRCKLVGGRMNPADVVLAPFGSAAGATDDTPSVASGIPDDDSVSSSAPHASSGETADSAEAAADAAVTPSPVDEAFQLCTRVRLTCDSCKYSRTHTESFLHLSLEIGPGCCPSVDDGLRRFFAPERRDIKCEKCFGESATQTTEITRLPPVLLLHLKRFIVEVAGSDYFYSSVSYRKDQSSVTYDPCLDLDEVDTTSSSSAGGGVLGEFLAPDCTPPRSERARKSYHLRSVVNHVGLSASCGHYTADAHRRRVIDSTKEGMGNGVVAGASAGKRSWTRFNDSTVTSITATQALEDSRRTAYLVAYELDDFDTTVDDVDTERGDDDSVSDNAMV